MRLQSPSPIRFDENALLQHELDPEKYGQVLWEAMFGEKEVRQFVGEARAASETAGEGLRLRLFIGPGAEKLHTFNEKRKDIEGAIFIQAREKIDSEEKFKTGEVSELSMAS